MKYLFQWSSAIIWWGACLLAVQVPLLMYEGVLPAFTQVVLHVQDVVLLFFAGIITFALCASARYKHWISVVSRYRDIGYVLLFLLILSLWAMSPLQHWLNTLRLLLLGYVGFGVAHLFPEFWRRVGIIFLWYVGFQGGIAWMQLWTGHDMGLQLLGEPILGTELYNVAKVHVLGFDVLRGYGLFVHPNLLAAYSAIALLLTPFLSLSLKQRRFWQILLVFAGLASLSKSFFVVLVGLLLLLSVRGAQFRPLAVRATIGLLFLFLVSPFVWGWEFIWERFAQVEAAFRALLQYPLGGGFGSAILLQDMASVQLFAPWEVQPVHNVLLLVALEWSLLGAVWLCILWWKALNGIRYATREYRFVLLGLLLVLTVFGLVDHFWFTLLEGQVLLVYALVWCSVLAVPRHQTI